jgi:hypothetical protein
VPDVIQTAASAEMAASDAGEPPTAVGSDRPAQTNSRTEKLRNEIGLALGIVVGLASFVQGYDSTDPFRTVVVALAIGFIGVGLIYASTTRR